MQGIPNLSDPNIQVEGASLDQLRTLLQQNPQLIEQLLQSKGVEEDPIYQTLRNHFQREVELTNQRLAKAGVRSQKVEYPKWIHCTDYGKASRIVNSPSEEKAYVDTGRWFTSMEQVEAARNAANAPVSKTAAIPVTAEEPEDPEAEPQKRGPGRPPKGE